MTLAIGAIFRDEYDYLVEWFAWHIVAGFKKFLIADNGSTDGTVALLEALSDIGVVSLIYQPVLDKQSQGVAYQRITENAMSESVEAVLFIDADEFLVHESMLDGEELRSLEKLLSDPSVGMVGINWRTFGSSGQKVQTNAPVLERFTQHLSSKKDKFCLNGHLKSITKIAYAKKIKAHISILKEPFKRVDIDGNEITDWVFPSDGKMIRMDSSGITKNVVEGPLRINHYVIKSEQEYTEKKRRRGSATRGAGFDRGEKFFNNHDFKDSQFRISTLKMERLCVEIEHINTLLGSTAINKSLRGVIDNSDANGLAGWVVDEQGISINLKLNIYVNGIWVSRVFAQFYRPDLHRSKQSNNGLCGFQYTHPKPLTSGDTVEVKVHANRYVFSARGTVTIT